MASLFRKENAQLISIRSKLGYGTWHSDSRDSNQKIETNYQSRKCLWLGIIFLVISVAVLAACAILLQQHPLSELSNTNLTAEPNFYTDLKFSSCFPTCQAKWCNIYSNILNATMNMSMDPCDDFFEHVCGNWNPSLSSLSYWSIQLENAHDIVQFALEEQKSSSTLQSKSKLIHFMTDLYQNCVDVPKRGKLDKVALLRQLMGESQLLFKISNISNSNTQDLWKTTNSSSNSTDVELWMDLFVEASLNGVNTIFKHVRVSDKTILIDYNIESYESNNQSLNREFVELKEKITSFFKIETLQWDSSLDHVLFEIIDFKDKIGRLYAKYKIDQESIYYNPNSIKQFLDNSLTNFNWPLLLGKFASKTGTTTQFMSDSNVKMYIQASRENFDLLTAITELICSMPIQVLKNVITIDYIDVLESKNWIFENNFPNDQNEANRLWRKFVDKDFERFLPLYTRLFVDYVGREKMRVARDQANEMMQNMKTTFDEMLQHGYNWLNDQTRVKAQEKVNAMKSMISHLNWIFNDTALDEAFGFDYIGQNTGIMQRMQGNFAASYLKLHRIIRSASFRKLNQKDSKQKEEKTKFDFTFGGIGFNVLYLNYISITHAMLLDPSFNVDYPIGLNYGNLGTTIGHEIVHGFDNEGIKYDKRGQTVNWWTDAAAQNYENRSQCFVQQYNKFGGNGTFTLGENIADNGGLNLAYRLFEMHLSYSKKHCNISAFPPFLDKFSHEQLFFLAYGLEHCSHRNYSTNWDPNDTHSALKYRVNIPLQNSAKFAQAFNCPVGAKMNPKDKCLLW